MEQGAAPRSGAGPERHRRGRPAGEEPGSDEDAARAPRSRAERLVAGTETGVRRAVQAAALALWAPVGLAFWLPLLLRRTVSYVFAVLRAGLTGGEVEGARARWQQAVDFYRVGFQRIVRAFGDGESFPRPADRGKPARGETGGSLGAEVLWSALVWVVALWLLGVWPEAPATIGGAAAGTWESAVEVGSRLGDRLP